MKVDEGIKAEKLYRIALDEAESLLGLKLYSLDRENEIFERAFSKEALEEENQSKFYIVLSAVDDLLIEEGYTNYAETRIVVSASDDAETQAVLFHKPSGKVLYFLSEKSWHVWDNPEGLKEDLMEIYKAVKDRLTERPVAFIDDEKGNVYLLPERFIKKGEITEDELQEKGRFLFEMGIPNWISLPVYSWEPKKKVYELWSE